MRGHDPEDCVHFRGLRVLWPHADSQSPGNIGFIFISHINARIVVNACCKSMNVNTKDVFICARAKVTFVAAKVYVEYDKNTWSSGCLN